MKSLQLLLAAVLALQAPILSAREAAAGDKVQVVATFSILADMAAIVGGERVRVMLLVGPGSDAHVFQATPADAVTLKRASLVIENGLGFEGWLDRLIAASGFKGERIVASKGITPLGLVAGHEHGHDHGHERAKESEPGNEQDGADPHAWQSLANAAVYVANIARGLCAADALGCAAYQANAAAYTAKISALDKEIAARFSALPADKRKVITSHTAFDYFGKRYKLEIFAPEGVSTEQEAAALDVAALIRQIRKNDIKALFVENVSDPRLIEQIARETGLKPAGRLYSDALSKAGGNADSYLAMMRHNANAIAEALEAAATR
ncbi:MAG: zinc ABC transporter substrate-binding protein [Alphaproteobacteria bacterium]|nr:zinc ABC transporter substrate-binding protein [Alphaproteobacteria bacterium]